MNQIVFSTPLGAMCVHADASGLRSVDFIDNEPASDHDRESTLSDALLSRTREEILEYFAGVRRSFSLPLAPQGTPFQQEVWAALRDIGYGQVCSYSELAHALARDTSVRAVAGAIARNPLLLLIPCHRVIGRDGSLTGFSAGLERKRSLLLLERPGPGGM